MHFSTVSLDWVSGVRSRWDQPRPAWSATGYHIDRPGLGNLVVTAAETCFVASRIAWTASHLARKTEVAKKSVQYLDESAETYISALNGSMALFSVVTPTLTDTLHMLLSDVSARGGLKNAIEELWGLRDAVAAVEKVPAYVS